MVGKQELNYTITYYKDYKRDRIDSFDTLIPGVNSNKVFITTKNFPLEWLAPTIHISYYDLDN